MAQELTLKTHKEPSWFNKEMAIGFLVGNVLGAAVGGYIGHERMKDEKALGKRVSSEPSFWNKDALLGGLLGNVGGALAALAVLAAGIMIAGATLPAGAGLAGAIEAAGAVSAVVASVVLAGATALGTFIGGRHGQKTEREEFAQAAAQQSQVFRQPGYSMHYSTGHAAQLEQQLAQSKDRMR